MSYEIGYALSCEEHLPNDLVAYAARAEEIGFKFAGISDHFHPWTDSQGQSPMVWPVLGAIANATSRLRVGTGVTCPTIRTHPAIIAHAAATVGAMMPGRFFLGVGTGENLNEHVLGDRWPESDIRQEMLAEAVEVIRLLWQGGSQSHHGRYYTVENARLYTLPDELPPIMVAAAGPKAAELAARIGDGMVGVSPSGDAVEGYTQAGGSGPRYGQATVCWADTEEEAAQTAHRVWPNAAVPGELAQELPMPAHFEQASQLVTPDHVSEMLPLGPDPERHIEGIRKYLDAGYDHVYVHQIGPDQEGFFRFYEQQVLPKL
ncbi:MAG: TIGR03557 family F420-dependent LLM class oxidoreductase [Actinomycetota bacterium]|nr:TIGR03557 family F420-dependent LLM class oxidoreductase [Actinomycetota bacterium]